METLPHQRSRRPVDKTWLLTFSDLIALLLTFFVMQFSMSSVDDAMWDVVVNALSQRLNPTRGWQETSRLTDRAVSTMASPDASDLEYLHAVIHEKLRADPLLAQATLRLLDDRLVIAIPGDLLFAPGDARLSDRAQPAIALLGDTLRHIGNRVDVMGHADPEPISSEAFPSNWDLSIGRALAVVDALGSAGYERSGSALGLSSSRFDELPADLSEEERYRLARRVDVVIRETQAPDPGDGS